MPASESPKEDQPKQQWSADPKLLAAITRMKPQSTPEGIVPGALPAHLKVKVASVTSEQLKGLYDVNKGVSMVSMGSLRAQDLIALHIKSYISLLETEDLKESRIRFQRVFSSVFHDVLNELRGNKPISPVSIGCIHILVLYASTT